MVKDDEGIDPSDWPSRSPDLNPTSTWGHITEQHYDRTWMNLRFQYLTLTLAVILSLGLKGLMIFFSPDCWYVVQYLEKNDKIYISKDSFVCQIKVWFKY